MRFMKANGCLVVEKDLVVWCSCDSAIRHDLFVPAELHPLVLNKLNAIPHKVVRQHVNDTLNTLAVVPIIHNNFCVCN